VMWQTETDSLIIWSGVIFISALSMNYLRQRQEMFSLFCSNSVLEHSLTHSCKLCLWCIHCPAFVNLKHTRTRVRKE
jgi:hypothetical protein